MTSDSKRKAAKYRDRSLTTSRPSDSQANSSGQFSAPMRWLLLRDGTIAGNSMAHVDQTFRNMAVYPDSEVIVATKLRVEDNLAEITSVYRPSPYHGVITENRGNWTMDGGVRAANLHAASRRRRNLRQTPLKSCLVVSLDTRSSNKELSAVDLRTRAAMNFTLDHANND